MIAEMDDEGEQSEGRIPCPVLATDRLILRRPQLEDAAQLALMANNVKVARMMTGMPHPYALGDAENFICRAKAPDRSGCTYAVTLKAVPHFIGCAGLSLDKDGRLQLGFWLGEPYWDKGYATEAAHALVDMAFQTIGAERVGTRCRVSNTGSRRVIEKCGFQFTGIGMLNSIAAGQFSAEHFTLERRVWASLKSWR